ncbi:MULTISPECIES: hypothetical protein [Hymenobacter]|uniref:Outer membrane protein beta-barrel domain-containing protein n=1 Tax=Hymenobacter jejuensis TaxID=2502781 RepID=A0A5B8A417_9BACT|nr:MULTISPECIES: hypothetical protein [Hymenobacter]MBC6990040.1 hypothetical protein [Hymenobacter sp. BT491]QDA62068.1 hypothetical protein FHG12_19050 [Hymenobacter jejuensis]
MKRLFCLLVLGGSALWLAPTASAQTDTTRTTVKPQLNTAPPGPPTPAPRPADQPAARPAVPVPAPPPVDQPLPSQTAPRSDSPSGLDFPVGAKLKADEPKSKYFLYTNFGLGYSSNPYSGGQFSASLAPAIGYRLTDKFSFGPGISYAFNSVSFPSDYRTIGFPNSVQLNSLGIKGFAQYMFYREFFIHAEYEVTRAESYNVYEVIPQQQYEVVKVKRTLNTPLLGLGYRQQFGQRAAGDITVLYNFNDGYDTAGYPLSPYGQPVIRFSFLFDIGR